MKFGKLKFGHNITMILNITHANFGGRRSCDTDLGTIKLRKMPIFVPKIWYFAYNKKWLNVERCNLDTTWVDIKGVSIPSLRAPSHVTKISEAENRQKVGNFEVVYLG